MDENPKFDLTNSKGLNIAEMFAWSNPLVDATMMVVKRLFSNPEEQSDAAKKLIEVGRANGCKTMEIKMKSKKGIICNFFDADVSQVHLGSDDEILVNVTYK